MKKTTCLLLLLLTWVSSAIADNYDQYYENLPVEVKRVSMPQIPANSVNLKDVGAVGDGVTLCTEAFEKGISRLNKQGGGRLVVPQGVWLTGPIMLKDHIELHLERNAIIVFSADKHLFLDKNPDAKRVYPCIRASKRHDIAITGEGIIDGNGEHWRPVKRAKVSEWEWKDYKNRIGGVETQNGSLFYPWNAKGGWANIADTPEKQEAMRNDLIRLTDCENVLIQGVTVQNSARFHVHPCYSRNVIIDGVTVRCPWNAQNGDAIDFSDVNVGLIVNSTVDAGDDGLCMKSGQTKPASPANGCEDIVIENNTVYHAHGGFVLGSETVSGMRRIVVRNCRFSGTDTGLRFKSGLSRGGKTEHLYISHIVMTDIKDEAIVFQCDYVDRPAGSEGKQARTFTEKERRFAPEFQGIHISDVVCRDAATAIKAKGIEGLNCIHDIDISRSTIAYRETATQIDEATAKLTLTDVNIVTARQSAPR